jgi:hypothetical protein
MVSPTISGMMVDDLDQVRITVLVPEFWATITFFISLG